ncbi:MAG: Fe-S cluster assembly protein HesB [Candidatus Heimdallarchaeota archaeon]|nr:Fe-S cluster assembly protein HesB [Candidatus Heimdallarchaeota archaeon]MCK4877915.1 Fe-S cluster assembly protein HesB [Candidatus Heimdallarchaeota archaeon]
MNFKIKNDRIISFQDKIFSWWKDNRREFPWRETTNPYFIMVSEIMLQQTQASRVVQKYLEFIERFPDMQSLSNSSQSDLLKLWSGLGYNRRALWLQEAVREILNLEEFPQTPKQLQILKGIGPYSARSVLIFAFNFDIATVDTNIRRILISEGFASEETSEKDLLKIAEQLLPTDKSRDWHNALMDYGSIVLTASKTGIKPTSQQGKFKGSEREKRGKILKFLLDNESATIEKLNNITNSSKNQLEPILDKMVKDGLIKKFKDKYKIE